MSVRDLEYTHTLSLSQNSGLSPKPLYLYLTHAINLSLSLITFAVTFIGVICILSLSLLRNWYVEIRDS